MTTVEHLTRNAVDVLPAGGLEEKLKLGRPLRVKLGIDVTSPDIHVGRGIPLQRMRAFQDAGHIGVLIVGDYTTRIGDPSGRSAERPLLSDEEIDRDARTYVQQASQILDSRRTEVRYNSEWLGTLDFAEILRLTRTTTVAQLLERDDFSNRFRGNAPIAIHEFLYPLLQGYDSVALDADVELGGTDQKFNLLVGRELQKSFGREPQCILTMPLLEGLDGVEKMSKSKGNYIGVTDAPQQMFGKLMSISDSLMWRYFELLSFRPPAEITMLKRACEAGRNPREAKVMLAQEIVARFHSAAEATAALAEFDARFKQGALPNDILEVTLATGGAGLPIAQLAKQAGVVDSTSDALRLIAQRGLKLDGFVVADRNIVIPAGATVVVQAGKRRFARVTVR